MEGFPKHNDLLITKKKNKVHKNSKQQGSKNIKFNYSGIIEEGVTLRGDLGNIDVDKFAILKKGCTIQPPVSINKKLNKHSPVKIGAFTVVGENTFCEAMAIGTCVEIGKNCKIGARCIIKDCSKILDNSVIPSDTIIPSLTVFGGKGEFKGESNECTRLIMEEKVKKYYSNYISTFSF